MADAVLVVDDDAAARNVIAQLLHLEGFAPITASNGLEALQFLRAGGPAKVILLDLKMPVMDGWAFWQEQRRDAKIAAIPVVVLSAAVDRPMPDAAACLRKP